MKKIRVTLMCVLLALSVVFFNGNYVKNNKAAADGTSKAWLYYSSTDWKTQCWGSDNIQNAIAVPATITGEGKYQVALTFTPEKADGINVLSVCIPNGESLFPGYAFSIEQILIDGEEVPFSKGYTYAENVYSRIDLYNTSTDKQYQKNIRTVDGVLDDTDAIMIPLGYVGRKISSIEVTFEYKKGKTPEVSVPEQSNSWKDVDNMSCTLKNTMVSNSGRKKAAVKVNWTKKADAYKYQIYRSKQENGIYQFLTEKDGSVISYTDKSVEKGTTYYYKVRALAGTQGNSYTGRFSESQKIVTSSTVSAPVVKFKKSGKKITFLFSETEGDTYQLQLRIKGKKWKNKKSGNIKNKITVNLSTKKKVQARMKTGMKINGKMVYSKWSSAVWLTK